MIVSRQSPPSGSDGPDAPVLSRRGLVVGASALTAAVSGRSPARAARHGGPSPTPAASPGDKSVTVALYLISLADDRRGPLLRAVGAVVAVDPDDRRVAAAALTALLDRLMDEDGREGVVTAIPAGVDLVSAELLDDGVVRVELSEAFPDIPGDDGDGDDDLSDRLATPAAGQAGSTAERALRLRQAQVVFTLTRFPTIDAVELIVAGEPVAVTDPLGNPVEGPVGRDAFEDVTPLILIESPLPGATIGPTFDVAGSSDTFEAALALRLSTADGDVLLDAPLTATSGNGVRGTFATTLTVPDGVPAGTLILRGYESSARDGSEVNVYEVEIAFDPDATG